MNRVYQGGHHDLWCDGQVHQRTTGGFCWPDEPFHRRIKRGEPFRCDCARWQGADVDNAKETA